MDTAKIIRLVALLVAVVAAFATIPYIDLIMVIVGLALGFMTVPEERRLIYMVTAVTLTTVAGALGPIPGVGDYLTAILGNLSAIVNAGAIAVIMMIVKDRLTE
ncbi:MAG: hypothetical protein GWM87_08550 [Xanthomonadales bacterium]|nr:hypothetical protein [Xanthomonadales bacterium]NIX12973.1 hypothetical protein [Xanthomonadales bacterium]